MRHCLPTHGGDPDVDALRTALEALLAQHAALEDARAGRSRAPW